MYINVIQCLLTKVRELHVVKLCVLKNILFVLCVHVPSDINNIVNAYNINRLKVKVTQSKHEKKLYNNIRLAR